MSEASYVLVPDGQPAVAIFAASSTPGEGQATGDQVSYVMVLDTRPEPLALRKESGPSGIGVPLMTGPRGIEGPQGPPGPSAYDYAVSQGFEGTEEQWYQTIRGFILLDPGVDVPPAGTPDGTFVWQTVEG